MLWRSLGLNSKNLYSSSYYYHQQKDRYYKYLLYSLERKNLNHFVAFIMEAMVLSMIDVVKTSLEMKRSEYMAKFVLPANMRLVLKPFIKRGELQFKHLARVTRGKVARQTLVNYLAKAVEQGILAKRESGRVTFYSLSFSSPEVDTLNKWLAVARACLAYVPDQLQIV